jgi:hypothetical protein
MRALKASRLPKGVLPRTPTAARPAFRIVAAHAKKVSLLRLCFQETSSRHVPQVRTAVLLVRVLNF